jgi:hypothetical protein
LTSGVSSIVSNGIAFAAIKANGSVVTWGDADNGGDSSSVQSNFNPTNLSISHTYIIENNDMPNNLPTGYIFITSPLSVGHMLTADTYTLSDADNLGPLSYQWIRNDSDINGAISSTYVLTQLDVDNNIRVKVSYIDGSGRAETMTSSARRVIKGDTMTQILNLKTGWNLVSFYVKASDMTSVTIFEPISNKLVMVKNLTQSYDPSNPPFLNTLVTLNRNDGYWIKVLEDVSLNVVGSVGTVVNAA